MTILLAHRFLVISCDSMSGDPKDHVVDNLMGCVASLCAFNLVTDLNRKLALLQQINKEYGALINKLDSENITLTDLDIAAPVAKEKVSSEVQRREAFGLDAEAAERLQKMCPSKVDQIITFLKQKRVLEIITSFSFKEPLKE
ncbi:MAG: hypothetical protein ACFFAL_00815 [Promethearchaeota archaeon]